MTSRVNLALPFYPVFLLLFCPFFDGEAFGLTPESPQVKTAVNSAVEFLKTANAGRVGGTALVGIALLKCDVPPDHPKIVEATNVVRREVNKSKYSFAQLYTPAVFLIFSS